MTIVAYPDKDSTETAFEYEFWITGEEYPIFEAEYTSYILKAEDPDTAFILFCVACGVIFILLILIFVCCVMIVCRKGHSDN